MNEKTKIRIWRDGKFLYGEVCDQYPPVVFSQGRSLAELLWNLCEVWKLVTGEKVRIGRRR